VYATLTYTSRWESRGETFEWGGSGPFWPSI